MNNYTKSLQKELNESNQEPILEIEVIDSEGEQDFILCEVYCEGNSIVARRVAVNAKEGASKYVACDKLTVDDAFSLDEHLQELYSLVIDSINEGGLFSIA
tara:strand:+ start:243 stop:545 length:303 start_codon:yes stop_codon:yes gene_type:complete